MINGTLFCEIITNRELKAKYHKLILFLDRAPPQHYRSKRVKAYLEKNNDVMTAEYLPKGSSELSAVEECWKQGKDDLLVSKYYPKITNLKAAITNYRTKLIMVCRNLYERLKGKPSFEYNQHIDGKSTVEDVRCCFLFRKT